jgi:carboxymethylenebutenolidase
MIDMATRLAAAGYVVLLPDLFYRFGSYTPLDPKEVAERGWTELLALFGRNL